MIFSQDLRLLDRLARQPDHFVYILLNMHAKIDRAQLEVVAI